jgi:hypothetical protein
MTGAYRPLRQGLDEGLAALVAQGIPEAAACEQLKRACGEEQLPTYFPERSPSSISDRERRLVDWASIDCRTSTVYCRLKGAVPSWGEFEGRRQRIEIAIADRERLWPPSAHRYPGDKALILEALLALRTGVAANSLQAARLVAGRAQGNSLGATTDRLRKAIGAAWKRETANEPPK